MNSWAPTALCCCDHVCGGVRLCVADVFLDAGGKEGRLLKDHRDMAPKGSLSYIAHISTPDEHVSFPGIVKRWTSDVVLVFPDPVGPTNAPTVSPGLTLKEMFFRIGLPASYPKVTSRNSIEPSISSGFSASSRSFTSTSTSVTSNIRCPDAMARCIVLYCNVSGRIGSKKR